MKKATIVILLAGGAALFLWLQHQSEARARAESSELREQLQQLAGQNQQLSNQLSAQLSAPPGAATETERELMKLRGEMNRVRRELAEAQAQVKLQVSRQQVQQKAAEQAEASRESSRELGIAKLNYTKGWLLALWNYAQQHEGKVPPDFESAKSFATEPATTQANLAPEQFEIVYNGSLNDLTNAPSVIVMREKQPWQTTGDGWSRTYGFADGHSEIHRTPDGNFESWEAQHTAAPAAPTPGQ